MLHRLLAVTTCLFLVASVHGLDPSRTTSGGPDAFGNLWINSLDPAGPAFEWVDISSSGTPYQMSLDDIAGPFAIGFDFHFYGEVQIDCFVGSNGYITFGQGWTTYIIEPIPQDGQGFTPDHMIAPFWYDFNMPSGGTLYVQADEENEVFIVQWHEVRGFNGGGPHTLQARLYPGGMVEFAYLDLDENDLFATSIGIENIDGSDGLQYHFQGAGGSLADSVSVLFLPPSDCDEVECAGQQEEEPNQGWADGSYNLLRCGDLYCGELQTTDTETDSDWYLYAHFGGTIEVDLACSGFDARLSLRQLEADTEPLIMKDAFPSCFNEAFIAEDLAPGSYYIVVEHAGDSDLIEAETYSLTVVCSGDPCAGHEPVDCTGDPEVEPNEGWSADPPNSSYGEIALDQELCGSTWATGGSRDQDWFRYVHAGGPGLRITCTPDAFDAVLYLTDVETDGEIVAAVNNTPACAPEELLIETLAAGEYYIVVTHADLDGVPGEQAYELELELFIPQADPCDDPLEAGVFSDILLIEEAAPIAQHHDGLGCPAFVASPGLDRVIHFELDSQTDLQIRMTGAGDADEVLLLLGDCADPHGSCGAAANAAGPGSGPEIMEIAGLEAGSYYLVADFAGEGETAPFELELIDMNSSVDSAQPVAFQLLPNRPNPFNPVTTLRWSQPEAAPARLLIHDLGGRLVEEILLGQRPAGHHSHRWDAGRFSSGIYLYTLQAGIHSETRKAVLLK